MKKILIIKPSSLGDIIHGLVVAQSIREQMPGCHISWVVRERFAPVVQGCPTVDQTIIFHRFGGIFGFFRTVREIRQYHYDYVLDFQGLARSGIMTRMTNASVRIGRSDAREGATLAYQKNVPLPPSGKMSHAIELLLQFLPAMGLEARLGSPIHLADEPLLPPEDQLFKQRPILLTPNSRNAEKEWPGFVDLTRLLLKRHPDRAVVWDSHKLWKTPSDLAGNRNLHNLTKQTSLKQMIGLIQSASVVVANDSGPLHIAAAVGTPVVMCAGPTPPERFGPYPMSRPTHRVLRAPDGDLKQLDVETVYAAVNSLLPLPTPQDK